MNFRCFFNRSRNRRGLPENPRSVIWMNVKLVLMTQSFTANVGFDGVCRSTAPE
jgi:hypothetical protein